MLTGYGTGSISGYGRIFVNCDHIYRVGGRPLSGNTWYICIKCGHKLFRRMYE